MREVARPDRRRRTTRIKSLIADHVSTRAGLRSPDLPPIDPTSFDGLELGVKRSGNNGALGAMYRWTKRAIHKFGDHARQRDGVHSAIGCRSFGCTVHELRK